MINIQIIINLENPTSYCFDADFSIYRIQLFYVVKHSFNVTIPVYWDFVNYKLQITNYKLEIGYLNKMNSPSLEIPSDTASHPDFI